VCKGGVTGVGVGYVAVFGGPTRNDYEASGEFGVRTERPKGSGIAVQDRGGVA
jgi:hypothetical protein